ncbi:MAG: serine hydrolase domain-containing protein [Betaproteobacteria bacterium]|jgi:CubicO group peptidase (beta-lactamase class C family)
MKKYALFLGLLLGLLAPAWSLIPTVDPGMTSGGQVRKFTNREFKPSASPVPLTKIHDLTESQKQMADRAESMMKRNAALAVVLIDRGRIVYEGYRVPANERSFQFSQSMSKSLTAYAIGSMLCEGKIASLDDRAVKYAPELQGTVYGDATVHNLLTMSSGTREAVMAGSQYVDEFVDLRGHRISIIDLLNKFSKQDVAPGRFFRYSGTDTFSLTLVADGAGGLLENFEKNIWNRAGTEASGYWLLDMNGKAMSSAGFSATARDWARLAMFSIQELKAGNDCMKKYMREATSKQLSNLSGRVGKAFSGYGYQTWTNSIFGSGYWWVGYGGQRVGIDPETERIIVVSSWREDYMEEVYRLFADFQRIR